MVTRLLTVPRRSPQLWAARLLHAAAPRLLRKGMAWFDPVPADVIERARERARITLPGSPE